MRSYRVRSLAVVAAVAVVSSAHAGFPALNVQWKLDGNTVYDEFPIGSPNGQGGFRYTDFHNVGAVGMNYSVIGKPDPRISSSFTVENYSNATIDVELLVTLPIAPSVPAPSIMTGSVAVGMTADQDGGLLTTLGNAPFWQALIDGNALGGATDLLPNLAMAQVGLGSPPGQNDGFFQLAGPEAVSDIGILIRFSLTAGDQMSFTSVFNVVPAPAGLAVLGLGVLSGRRRRRAC